MSQDVIANIILCPYCNRLHSFEIGCSKYNSNYLKIPKDVLSKIIKALKRNKKGEPK